METSHGMEIARLLLSLLHAWGLDKDLDSVCQAKLGLLRPMVKNKKVNNQHMFIRFFFTIRYHFLLVCYQKLVICHYFYQHGIKLSP